MENVEKITINVAPMHFDSPLNQPFEIGEFPQGNATFSLRHNVVNVLLRKSVKLEHFTEEFIRDREIGKLTLKVNVTGTIPPNKIEAAGVKVQMKDGREFNAYVDVAKGNPLEKPLGKEEIEDKYRANAAFSKTISEVNSEKALEIFNHLEEIDDIAEVVHLLTV